MFNPNKVTRDDQNRPLAVYSMCNGIELQIMEIDHDYEQVLWRMVSSEKMHRGSSLIEYEFKDDGIEACFVAMGNVHYIGDFLLV